MTRERSHAAPSVAPPAASGRPSAQQARLPQTIQPMLALMGGQPFDSPRHIFEVKWDGVRALAFIDAGRVRLQDRYLRDVTDRYPELRELARRVRAPGTVLDGEIVVLDGLGRPDVSRLRQRLEARDMAEARRLAATTPVTFQAFDILYWQGRAVMGYPLWRRKRLLEQASRPSGYLAVPGFIERDGVAFFESARRYDLEGIVAKERDSAYLPGQRSEAWLKLKVYQKEEFVIGGFTYGGRWSGGKPRRREPFASLLLGLYDEDGALRYVGEVGGGFAQAGLEETVRALDALVSERCPFRESPPPRRLTFWCRPELVASVRFSEWTRDGRLRFPVFEGLRPDVPPESCRLDPPARE